MIEMTSLAERPMHRILDLSESPARLRVAHRQLVVHRDDGDTSVPLNEVAVLIVAHAQITYTHAVLTGVVECGGVFVTCNEKSLPIGMLLPLAGHGTQVERFAAQATASAPTKKRMWQKVVRAKIAAQASALEALHGDDAGLRALLPLVRSGDPANVEARAARRYWPALFIEQAFRRDRDATGSNAMLNYGYAVLRAITARAICASGLHPSLGIHHHNRYGTYPLADDLMEPLRPIVDTVVAKQLHDSRNSGELTTVDKRALLESLLVRYECGGEQRTLFDITQRLAASLCDVLIGKRQDLCLPKIL
jgi:CRISP-associated protein Cas1